jgi:PRTRC genetic system protein A
VNAKDEILQLLTPVVPVPRFEALASDSRGEGHRFLVAGDGLWAEAETPWLHVRVPVARSAIPLPFGTVEAAITFKCGTLPRALLEEFVAQARQASPNETAAIMTWRPDSDEFRLLPVVLEAGTAHVRYKRPRLPHGEYLVADLHSHGIHQAGFSAQDDRDDFGEIKVAIVVGCCDTAEPQIAARLCVLGLHLSLPQFTGGFDEA